MLLLCIWSSSAALFDKSPPKFTEIILPESAFTETALIFHSKLSSFFSFLQDVAMGKNLRLFFMAIVSLWIISIIGSSCSSLSLLYFGYLCIQILPVLYENYEEEANHFALKGSKYLRKIYRKFDSKVLSKIPRGPVKVKKQL
ncbi:reticulon-like protein B9 [Phalaenopsis equestris]|uniref:reticulon-like protein B9 n=1 Tax=Phalaenopsis equestris TaxID=78828 RepID=UPI0009E2A2AC|nr:reticulon-like protein B9 [Phalaenopsis equestris]